MARFSNSDWSSSSPAGEFGRELDLFEAEEDVSEDDSELALEMLIMLTAALDIALEITGAGGNGNMVAGVVMAGEDAGVVVMVTS